ncbi:sensor histidine kinase [Sanguibacter sp. 25GB23B1]|uniref:sensor histidine kinase n=1 Tax=unclassified Sanguibacter TaxID=2645534 RepID=UPI0032AF4965
MTADADVVTVGGQVARDAHTWTRVLSYWHLAFYVLVAIAAGSLVAADPGALRRGDLDLLVALGALGALVLVYWSVGRRAVDEEAHGLGYAYLAVLFTVTALVTGLNPMGTVLLFVAYSQIWLLAPTTRVGAWLCAVLTTLVTLSLLFRLRDSGESTAVIAFQMLLGFAFAILMGVWLRTIIQQGERRSQLLDQLQAAQEELGRTQHAAGVTAERERVAREIHDTLAQGFTSVVMLAQTAAADLDRGATDALATRLSLIERTARENLAEARSLVAAFAPPSLHDSTLSQALERLAAAFATDTETEVHAEVDRVESLPTGADVVLLRAAQESLSNVRRHARAQAVHLTLRAGAATTTLGVRDDGTGIAPGTREGFGLRGMRERVVAYGGTVEVTSDDSGTCVTVVVPGVSDD